MKNPFSLIIITLLIFFSAENVSSLSILQGNVPGYKMKTLAGKRISLKDYRGSPLLLNFWATWCAPCRKEFPIIKEIENKFGKDGLVVLAINVDIQEQFPR